MNIGRLAAKAGVSPRMIRHYEGIGLIRTAARTETGYRTYDEADVATVRFIGRARALGFSLEEIAELLSLWRDRSRASADVKLIVDRHIEEIEGKIAALQALQTGLNDLAERCHDDERPECPILDDLATGAVGRPRKRHLDGSEPQSLEGRDDGSHPAAPGPGRSTLMTDR